MKAMLFGLALLPLTLLGEPVGETYVAGTTWFDLQHDGSCGRMIALDTLGYVHIAWLNGVNSSSNPRHIYYNVWSPETEEYLFGEGAQVNAYTRSGFVTLDCTPDGHAVPVYYDDNGNACCCDVLPRSGSFDCFEHAGTGLYMTGALDTEGRLHVVYHDYNPEIGFSVFYAHADNVCEDLPEPDWSGPLIFNEELTLAHTITAARHSGRIAVGWTHPRPDLFDGSLSEYNSDGYVRLSEDRGDVWSDPINFTNFVAGDLNCLDSTGDWAHCVHDTFRLYTDMSLLFDESDDLHAAFTARASYDFNPGGDWAYTWIDQSGIWHWSETTGNFSLIARAFYFQTIENGTLVDNGIGQLNVQRPSLAIDTYTGYLYCAYMSFDSTCYSDAGYPMADVYVSVSTNNGESWSVGTNVTRTCPGTNVPPPGSTSEREPTLAEVITDGMLHLSYVLDHDAGSAVMSPPEGVPTENEFVYQRIPVDSIATTPLVPNLPLHADSTGFDLTTERVPSGIAERFELRPAYPNPFNSTTTISFELSQRVNVDLTVYDVLGRAVATLVHGVRSTGKHQVTWSPNDASGVYFLRLQAGEKLFSQKLMFLR